MNKKKSLITLLIIIVVAILVNIGFSICMNYYFDNVFYGEDYISSYDGKYAYLEFTSPKKLIGRIAIVSNADNPVIRTDVGFLDLIYRSGDIFRRSDLKRISWGIDTYDLFFEVDEKGLFCYHYEDEEWVGEMYLDTEQTNNEIANGNKIFCFKGDRKVRDKITDNNPAGFERISCKIPAESIPEYFLNEFTKKLN